MKNISEYILENVAEFPTKWKKKSGITSIEWYCGNELVQEYLRGASGAYCIQVMPWFQRCMDRIDTISINIYDREDEFQACVYFNIGIAGGGLVGGRGIQFEGTFATMKDAKKNMYELLCKIRDDKDIFRKLSSAVRGNSSQDYLNYDEFMKL